MAIPVRSTGRRQLLTGVTVLTVTAALLGTGISGSEAATGAAKKPGKAGASKTFKPAGVRWGGSKWGDPLTDLAAKVGSKNDPTRDAGSLATVTTAIGARALWGTKDANGKAITGQGVTVALLDTGINSTVAGLNGSGKVIQGPDLSFEANSPTLAGGDNFGHGTHLAGIIAAADQVATDPQIGGPKPPASGVAQLGVAPDAKLLAVKLGTTDGSTDVSQVIAAIDWTVQHRNDNGMNIRVINLSYGTDSTQSYKVDPLAAAVENAWQKGIVVVVSGGNDGPTADGLTNPAIDPYVIAVGASDANTNVLGWTAPTTASFSSRGTLTRHVDLLAPGTSIASLRDPGSYVDVNYPSGLVAGDTTGRLFRGSGTSQAAAVVSGSVALLLQAYPNLTPDQVKYTLTKSADLVLGSVLDTGAGELDLKGALDQAKAVSKLTPTVAGTITRQTFTASTGLGSLEAARGGSNLADPFTGALLKGEVDVQNQPWKPAAWRAAETAGTAWTGGTWNGAVWTGTSWSGARWSSAAWSGARWSGARWSDAAWDGARWSGARWTGARWTGARWSSGVLERD